MKFILLLSILLFSFANSAYAIKKCKDADGNWHYGDVAVAECESSQVTTLNERGTITEQLAAPKSEQELAAEKAAADQEELRTAKKRAVQEERLRILSIYETEADIDRLRDSQLNSVQSNIDVHDAYLKNMDSRIAHFQRKIETSTNKKEKAKFEEEITRALGRIANSKKELALLAAQKKEISEKFVKEKELYRRITQSAPDEIPVTEPISEPTTVSEPAISAPASESGFQPDNEPG